MLGCVICRSCCAARAKAELKCCAQTLSGGAEMAGPEPEWETERLMARPSRPDDAHVVFEEYARDPAVARYMTWTPHRKVQETLEFLRRCQSAWLDGSAFLWTL